MTEKAEKYMNKMDRALAGKLFGGLYGGVDGHKRLAREIGYALNDFDEKDRKEICQASYGRLYVKNCALRPTMDAKEWIAILRSQIKSEVAE